MYSRIRVLACACLVVLVVGLIGPPEAQAAKAPKALLFDQVGLTEVATVYETAYATQKATVKALKLSSKAMKKALGFRGSATLKSQDGKQVIVLSQWQDAGSYQAYATTATTATQASAAPQPAGMAPSPMPTQTILFQLERAQPSIAGSIPALRGKEAVVQLSRFKPKTPASQADLLTQIQALIPTIGQTQPVPQSVLLLQAPETGDVALLTNWNCSAMFPDVGAPAPLTVSEALLALADQEQALYDVINFIPAEVKQPEPDEEPA